MLLIEVLVRARLSRESLDFNRVLIVMMLILITLREMMLLHVMLLIGLVL